MGTLPRGKSLAGELGVVREAKNRRGIRFGIECPERSIVKGLVR